MADTNTNKRIPRLGEIYFVQFGGSGSVQSGWRPGVVFQNNAGNLHSPNVVMLPLTTSLKKLDMPTHVLLKAHDTGLLRDSVVLCENPQCIPKEQLGKYITRLSDGYMKKIAAASLLASSAISYLDVGTMMTLWQQANSLNAAS